MGGGKSNNKRLIFLSLIFQDIIFLLKQEVFDPRHFNPFLSYQEEKKYLHALSTQRLCGFERIICKTSMENFVNQRHSEMSPQKGICAGILRNTLH